MQTSKQTIHISFDYRWYFLYLVHDGESWEEKGTWW